MCWTSWKSTARQSPTSPTTSQTMPTSNSWSSPSRIPTSSGNFWRGLACSKMRSTTSWAGLRPSRRTTAVTGPVSPLGWLWPPWWYFKCNLLRRKTEGWWKYRSTPLNLNSQNWFLIPPNIFLHKFVHYYLLVCSNGITDNFDTNKDIFLLNSFLFNFKSWNIFKIIYHI